MLIGHLSYMTIRDKNAKLFLSREKPPRKNIVMEAELENLKFVLTPLTLPEVYFIPFNLEPIRSVAG